MNKKAQFYIITAVILLALTYGFFRPKLTYARDNSFEGLYKNYIEEAPIAANSGNLDDFSRRFSSYAGTKVPGFGLAYLYVQNSNITVLNLVKKTIFINDVPLGFNQSAVMDRKNRTTLTLESGQYVFETSEYPKVLSFFYAESEGSKKVYVKNE